LRGIVDRHGPNAVASYMGNPTAFNTLAGPAVSAFFTQLGVRRVFSSGTQDCANKFAGSEAVFGSARSTRSRTGLGPARACAGRATTGSVLGNDPMERLREAKRRGAKLYFVNPRRIESVANSTGEWIPIRPDTDVYLLAALLCEIDAAGGFDERLLAQRGKNVEAFRAFIRRFPAKRVADVTAFRPTRSGVSHASGAPRAGPRCTCRPA
jgi:anaerobic selenocysteine-containing dehydrogenase